MRGHEAIGFDADPLAILISRAWCADMNETRIRNKAKEVLKHADNRHKLLQIGDAYPQNADDETRAFVRFWFDDVNRKQLAALAWSIGDLPNPQLRELLWCAFSRLIITKQAGASLAMDVSHSRPHRVYQKAPIAPFAAFLKSVNAVIRAMPFRSKTSALKARISLGDARDLPLENASIDLVVLLRLTLTRSMT
jgi:hypothetical protein